MPKAPRRLQKRPSGPYDLRATTTSNKPIILDSSPEMGDPFMPMGPHHSTTSWGHQQYPQYPPSVMSSGPDYTHSMLAHPSAMATPVLPPYRSSRTSHSRQPSQSTPWTQAEDETLRHARQKGLGWSAIQAEYFPGKSGNACRKRYERVMVKNRGSDWDEQRFETLAAEYKELRGQIWQPLALRVGEKWETVEKICMSQGLKTLNNKASSHHRNQSSSGGGSVHRISSEYERERSSHSEEFHDSGLHDSDVGLNGGRDEHHGRRHNGYNNSASLGNILHDVDVPYGRY